MYALFLFRGSWFCADFCWNCKKCLQVRGSEGISKWYILGGYLFEIAVFNCHRGRKYIS